MTVVSYTAVFFFLGTLLTCVLLMQAIDRHRYQEDTFTKLNQLTEVDCHRSGYYRDLC